MAELAVLGLVANIFQFIETGLKIALTAKDVYQCVENLQTREIRLLLDDIKHTGANVAKLPRGVLSRDEVAICEYSDECNKIAAELDALAAKFARRDGAKSSALDSFRISWHSHTKKNEVQGLVDRLRRVDERLRARFDAVLQRQAGLENEARWSSVMLAIERLDVKAGTMQGIVLDSAARTLRSQLNTKEAVADSVQRFLGEIRSMQFHQNQLESLLFPYIKQRFSDITPAHEATFKWIFDRGYHRFSEWLEQGSGYYWVHGLAGSGKSTLMKYIYEHESTMFWLRKWAGGKRLVTANFFFWSLGTRMQKSQLGLLQSLLFQLVSADSSLAATIFSTRQTSEPWTANELREAFRSASACAENHTKFCFFIDGLDEYEGEETDIISTLADLLSSPNIKICLASRPWNRFREAYSDCPGLTLEYLTKTDIFEYVQSELLSNRFFQRSVEDDPSYQGIITQIADQARGVFLWVFLVIRSLMRDIRSRESIEHLQRRVSELPPSLDEYFKRIFDRIDVIYRQQTARLFLVALYLEEHDEEPLPLMAYNCLEAEVRDPYYAAKQRLLARDPDWINSLSENIPESQRIAIIRLDDRCKDLLQPRRNEAFHPASIHYIHISLLHRTVRDFFRDNYYDALWAKAGGNFSPEGCIANCLLWLFKTYPIKLFFCPTTSNMHDLPEEVKVIVQKYSQPEEFKMSLILYWFWSHVMASEPLIDDRVIESFFDTMITLCGQTWPQRIVPQRLTRYLSPYPANLMLTPWAAFLNLNGYLRRNWRPGKAEGGYFDYEVLALLLALEPRYIQALPPKGSVPMKKLADKGITAEQPVSSFENPAKSMSVPISPSTIQTLMELGCDPRDQKLGLLFLERFSSSGWDSKAMVQITQAGGKSVVYGSNRNAFEVAKVMFQHGLSLPLGPDEEIRVCKVNFGSIFRPIFGADGVAELLEIRRRYQGHVSWTHRLSRAFGGSGN
ncbi:hypothetical protein PG985_010554 [Apiospora marii]|uniref:NACHT domain-containing protein n=1 Tax=Apiospora marii TaxID=335849 RepID=A0ABR1T1A4_9PEZI